MKRMTVEEFWNTASSYSMQACSKSLQGLICWFAHQYAEHVLAAHRDAKAERDLPDAKL